MSGTVGKPESADWFSLEAGQGELVILRLAGSLPGAPVSDAHEGCGSTLQARVAIHDAKLDTVPAASDVLLTRRAQGSLRLDSAVEIAFIAPRAGTWHVAVSDATGAGGPELFYLLERD
jgi:hypothetical protein